MSEENNMIDEEKTKENSDNENSSITEVAKNDNAENKNLKIDKESIKKLENKK